MSTIERTFANVVFTLLLLVLAGIPMAAGAALYAQADHHYEFTHGPGCPAPTYET